MIIDLASIWESALFNAQLTSPELARFRSRRNVSHSVQALQLLTRVVCDDTNEPIEGNNGTGPIHFFGEPSANGSFTLIYVGINGSQLLDKLDPIDAWQWRVILFDTTDLEELNVLNSSIAAIVLAPQSRIIFKIILCLLD